jgi:predicted nucleic acid-binding protein
MKILLDTNVLLRLEDSAHAQHAAAFAAVEHLGTAGQECVLVPQVVYEFWVVATRPLNVNGMGLDVSRVDRIVAEWQDLFPVLTTDEASLLSIWRNLVVTHAVEGKPAHDARLVAAMLRHGVTHLLTFNTVDFKRFTEIVAVSPEDVVTGRVTLP